MQTQTGLERERGRMRENGGVQGLEVSLRSKTAVKRMKEGRTWKNGRLWSVREQDMGANISDM